jgi:hypothetical protein
MEAAVFLTLDLMIESVKRDAVSHCSRVPKMMYGINWIEKVANL